MHLHPVRSDGAAVTVRVAGFVIGTSREAELIPGVREARSVLYCHVAVFEEAGVIFEQNGGGPGVRLKHRQD